MKKHCERFDLQQGRFADSAILTAIQQWDGNGRPAGGNGHAAPKRKAAK
jgi:hypothetical protein